MLRHLTGLNHSIVATHDLEVARATFEDLGFCLTPRGVHPSRGTANYCMMFSSANYIELLGLSSQDHDDAEPLLEERLRSGEGIAAVAFDSDNGEALWDELAAIGVRATKPSVGKRDLEIAGQRETVRFEILRLPPESTPGLRTFICRHLDPLIVYHTNFRTHANTAQVIKTVTLIVDDLIAIANPYEALLGRPQVSEGALSFQTGNSVLQFVTPAWAERNLWPDNCDPLRCPESFVTFGVDDIQHAGKIAAGRGYAVHAIGARSLVENTNRTCGVGIIYEAVTS